MRVLVTGASGFVGRHLINRLVTAGLDVVGASRCPMSVPGMQAVIAPALRLDADWENNLLGISAVIHLAGKAHVVANRSWQAEAIYHRINCEGTVGLARQAVKAGVRHFIYLSSCHAVASESEDILTERSVARPSSAYGRSKLAAEQRLCAELQDTCCRYTILRPPLVYGPGNVANFARLIRHVKSGIPIPLGSVRNRRSFVGIDNLVSVIFTALERPVSGNRIYLPCDGEDVSTPDLITLLARAYRSHAKLVSIPHFLMNILATCPGLEAVKKLTSSLFVDSGPLVCELEWEPTYSLREGLEKMARSESLSANDRLA